MKNKRVALPRIKPKYARFRLRLGRSGIHGFGVYAREEIPARRAVIEYSGRPLEAREAASIEFPEDIYLADLKNGYCVDGGSRGQRS
jgi:hypothetical protein